MTETPAKPTPPQPAGTARRRRRRRRVVLVAALAVLAVAGPPAGYYVYWFVFQTNFHVVADGLVYRSAQPSPEQITRWTRQYGLKTIINLRGGKDTELYQQNLAAAEQAGAKMEYFSMSAVRLPKRQDVRRLIEVLETAERPILIHCRHGADRTGVVSVMAAMAVAGQDYATARGQLSIRYLHVYHGTDRVGGLLDHYEEYCRHEGLDTGGWEQFKRWALTEYRKYE